MPISFVIELVFLIHIATDLSLHFYPSFSCSHLLHTHNLSLLEYSKVPLESISLISLIILKFIAAENKIFIDVQPHLISLSAAVML